MANTLTSVMWTFAEAQQEVKRVQQASRAFGYHVALGGGVLNVGKSEKDLDLYFLALDDKDSSPNAADLVKWLESLWGAATPINDPRYGDSVHYARKLKFQPLGSRRIDVFVVHGSKSIAD